MPKLAVQPTITAQWHELVQDAQRSYGYFVGVDLEHYLIVLLQRYVDKPELMCGVLALDYLDAAQMTGSIRKHTMRDIGDKCLLFSGLFPEHADKRHVSINYFVDMGRSAYGNVADHQLVEDQMAKLFDDLEKQFVGLMDILHTIREMGGEERQLSLLHAFDLWQHTNSKYAREVIDRHTDGFLVHNASK